jgi:hypothetical protein
MAHNEFTITVTALSSDDAQTAVAETSAFLAYTDQTDTIGYAPNFNSVTVHEEMQGVNQQIPRQGPDAVTFEIGLAIEDDDHLKRFMDELTRLSRVVSVSRTSDVIV